MQFMPDEISSPIGSIESLIDRKNYIPAEPRSLEETGLTESSVEALILKHLGAVGSASGRNISEHICLSFGIMEKILHRLRTRQFLAHRGSAALSDYVYTLTDRGEEEAQLYAAACAYRGPAPVPLTDYVNSVDAQTITAESPRQPQLTAAFRDISVDPAMFAKLGPAVNSGAGLFLYGAPGNGKTTLAERITRCFGQEIWIPQTLSVEGEIIKLFDPAYHEVVQSAAHSLMRQDAHDKRWVRVRRPTVVVGGELTMDNLEISHNAQAHICEAPLQLKSNCGSLLIDDFGRQRLDPVELLNRWIVPLEKHYDFLSLPSGKKIQVPFDQLILFSTNLEPTDLADEAFLRRIPYKINVPDPDEEEFHRLFETYAPAIGCDYNSEAVDHLLEQHYRPTGRPLRRCHPRDLLLQTRNYCRYVGCEVEMKAEYFDLVVENYFTVVGNQCKTSSRQI
jgi:predicted ATPase with chaperone activity